MVYGWHPGYAVLKRLRDGETVEIENTGIFVKKVPGELRPGDDYVGARNTVNLLSVASIEPGWVAPVEVGYGFNLDECVRVEIIDY